jgi:hypothetical protein
VSTDLFSDLLVGDAGEGFFPADDIPTFTPTEQSPSNDPTVNPDGKPDWPVCEVCGKDLPWKGSGRKPKLCQDHKTRGRAVSGDAPARPATSKKTADRLATISGDLQAGLGQLAGTIAPVAPVTAVTMAMQGPGAMDALVRIAADYPRFLDGLEAAAKAVPFLEIAKFFCAMVLSTLVDMRRLTPEGVAAEYLGVSTAAAEAGWQPEEARQVQASQADWTVPPPPRFTMG